MIGSHDTFTYLKSTSWIFNNCKKYWKCQCKSIDEQYKAGIRMFDIRLYRDGKFWKPCHGAVNLKGIKWVSLVNLISYMNNNFKEAIFRIWLEKGNEADENLFKRETEIVKYYIADGHESLLWRVGIKNTKEWKNGIFNRNQYLYNNGYKFALVDTWVSPAYELHESIDNINDVLHKDLRKGARKINSLLPFFNDKESLNQMICSKDTLYLLDYCTNEY